MKYLFSLLIASTFIFCNVSKKIQKIESYSLNIRLRFINEKRLRDSLLSNILFYYQNDNILYKFPVIQLNEDLAKPKPKVFQYLVFSRNSRKGFLCDSDNMVDRSIVNVDSLLDIRAFGKISNILNNQSLVSLEKKDAYYCLIEKYVNKIQKNEFEEDSSIISYTKSLNRLHFSFIKNNESTKGLQVGKIEVIYNPIFDYYKVLIPQIQLLSLEVFPIPSEKDSTVSSIFKNFEKYMK